MRKSKIKTEYANQVMHLDVDWLGSLLSILYIQMLSVSRERDFFSYGYLVLQ